MFCPNCGAEVSDNAAFCTNCGTKLEKAPEEIKAAPIYDAAEVPVAPTPTEAMLNADYNTPAPVAPVEPAADNSTAILTLGIIATAVSEFGIPGIIVGAIGRKKAKKFIDDNVMIFGKAKVGSILANVGIIVGIVMTVFWALYILGVGALVGSQLYMNY